eukprot:4131280-Pyramimonas_sp.AAC.1
MKWQADRGRAAFIGIFAQTVRRQAVPLQAARGRSEYVEVVTDALRHDPQHPESGEHLKIPTRVLANPEICDAVKGSRDNDHQRESIKDRVTKDDAYIS